MIEEQIRVEYLSPERWGRLGEVIQTIRPPRRILYALQGETCERKAYDVSGYAVDLTPWQQKDGRLDGDGLLLAHPEVDELQLWPKDAVPQWYTQVNLACEPNTTIGEYLQTLRVLPCRRFVRQGLPAQQPDWRELLPAPQGDCVQAKLMFQGKQLYFDALLLWQGGVLKLLTSLDRYPAALWQPVADPWDFEAICDMIKAEFAVPVDIERLDWNPQR